MVVGSSAAMVRREKMALYMQVLCGVYFIDTSITWKIARQHSEPEGMGVYSVKIFMR